MNTINSPINNILRPFQEIVHEKIEPVVDVFEKFTGDFVKLARFENTLGQIQSITARDAEPMKVLLQAANGYRAPEYKSPTFTETLAILAIANPVGLFLAFISGCSNEPTSDSGCTLENLRAQEGVSYDELENSLLKLVIHNWDFQTRFAGTENLSTSPLLIPESDTADDRISGKGTIGDPFSPNDLGPEEGYLYMKHSLCEAPVLIINGAILANKEQDCNYDPACLDSVTENIHTIDKRNGNTFYADKVKYYAQAAEKRYDHGVKKR